MTIGELVEQLSRYDSSAQVLLHDDYAEACCVPYSVEVGTPSDHPGVNGDHPFNWRDEVIDEDSAIIIRGTF